MASAAIEAFHRRLIETLDGATAELLRNVVGGGPETRELHRGLMLADRAARDWLGSALASIRPKELNVLEDLPQLATPENGYHDLEPAGRMIRASTSTAEEDQIGSLTEALGRALQEIDTESSLADNRQALEEVGTFSADALCIASKYLGGTEFVVRQANEAMKDLIALRGWTNVLGDRFKL